MQKERILTCIVCPRGCEIKVAFDEQGKIENISGNACKRGAAYAEDECTDPKRTVTSTARCAGGGVIPVKTTGGVPKALVFEVMRRIAEIEASADATVGDVVEKNLMGLGVDLVITGKKGN